MLAIEVELLTGRYFASRYNDRSRPEWPPHPARLFSALVATHYSDEQPAPAEREALRWLERQSAPAIWASPLEEVSEREPHSVFVPVNDPAVVKNFDEDFAELQRERAEAEGDPKTLKKLQTKETKLLEKVARELAPGKVNAAALKSARSLFPETRTRQPRTFPSARPADPRVYFVWDASPEEQTLKALAALSQRLVRLGHSSSLVRARVVEGPPGKPNWRPDEAGEHRLRVVGEGQLALLDEAFERHRETQPRVLPSRFQTYTTRTPRSELAIPASLLGEDWLVLRRTGGPGLPSSAGPGVARTLRHVLMKYAEQQPAPEIITGHGAQDVPSNRPHLAIVPLPFVGHARADGSLLGVALVLPRDVSAEDRRAVFRALGRWEAEFQQDGDDAPALPVHLGAAGEWYLTRLDESASQSTLRASTWCGPALEWVSAMPVALDKNPGELKDRDPAKARAAAEQAEQIIAAACVHLGLPEPESVTVLPHSALAGSAKAKHFGPFPAEKGKTRRLLVHARIRFQTKVRGPVILGAGRYLGLGLFRPVHDHG